MVGRLVLFMLFCFHAESEMLIIDSQVATASD
jgi:hypothetical protein